MKVFLKVLLVVLILAAWGACSKPDFHVTIDGKRVTIKKAVELKVKEYNEFTKTSTTGEEETNVPKETKKNTTNP